MISDTVVVLIILGYIVIAAVVMGIADREQSDTAIFFAVFWPIFLVALAVFAIGYFPYKIANGSFRRKEK